MFVAPDVTELIVSVREVVVRPKSMCGVGSAWNAFNAPDRSSSCITLRQVPSEKSKYLTLPIMRAMAILRSVN